MIAKLLPDQIARNWDVVKYAMEQAIPELGDKPATANKLLEGFLMGRLSCWAVYRMEEDNYRIGGLFTTTIVNDDCLGTNSLLIYTGYALTKTSAEDWLELYRILSKEAKATGCDKIIIYTDKPWLIERAVSLGAFSTTLLSLDLYDDVKEAIDEDLFESSY